MQGSSAEKGNTDNDITPLGTRKRDTQANEHRINYSIGMINPVSGQNAAATMNGYGAIGGSGTSTIAAAPQKSLNAS